MSSKYYEQRKKQRDRIEKLSPRLFECLREGHTIVDSCKAAGLPISTVYEWSRVAKEDPNAPEVIVDFHFNFIQAQADSRYLLLQEMRKPTVKIKEDGEGNIISIETRHAPSTIAQKILTRWEYQVNKHEEEPEDNPLVQLMGIAVKKDDGSQHTT